MSSEYGQFLGHQPEAHSQNEIVLISGDTKAVILPQGAMIKEWEVGDNGVLFPSQTIEGKLRGGIPILFPIAGTPKQDGEFVKLPQHGFARENLWTVSN